MTDLAALRRYVVTALEDVSGETPLAFEGRRLRTAPYIGITLDRQAASLVHEDAEVGSQLRALAHDLQGFDVNLAVRERY